jgi:hypothetical protein
MLERTNYSCVKKDSARDPPCRRPVLQEAHLKKKAAEKPHLRYGKRNRIRYWRRYVIRFGREETDCTGVVLNLSGTGLFISSTHIFRPGVHLLLDFIVEGSPYHLEGVVRWARQAPASLARQIPSGMGVELLSPPDAYLELVQKIETRSPRSFVR